ncbi:MAG: sulfatase-like hydrolase/transferase, partial [Anaerolineales bacterium]
VLALPKLKGLNITKTDGASNQAARHPNILLIGSDGVNARNMSLYGYQRDTTPNLSKLANESLVAENAFTNSGNTSGSIISIFNSKLPTQTRLIYPPDILRGSDAYQHLPGILRSLGYTNKEISAAHYIDAYTLNVRDGFDEVNERSVDQAGFQIFTRLPGFQDSGYFLSVLFERISDRLLHIFFIRPMVNPYQEVTTNVFSTNDQNKVRKLLDDFRYGAQPMFVHVHLMGTHGAFFNIDRQVYSAGQTQEEPWMTDFYDDSILAFDEFMGVIWSELTKMDMLDNTIIIVYSDHAQDYHTEQSVPLLIRFPHGEYARRVRSNVENLDIAPTILDYLGIPIPDWMAGQSLLDADPDPLRPIFSTGVSGTEAVAEDGFWVTDETRIQPPFYQFAYLRAVVCQEWYLLDLRDYYFNQGEVLGHSAPCPQETLPDKETIVAGMMDRLALDGFDISPLQERYSPPTSD